MAALVLHMYRDRSINRSVVIIAPYALTTNSDLELFSPVTSSDEDISIFRGYYCTYQLAERPVCKVFAKSPANAPAKRKKLFQSKNTSAQSALGDTGSLNLLENDLPYRSPQPGACSCHIIVFEIPIYFQIEFARNSDSQEPC